MPIAKREPADDVPALPRRAVIQAGDVWLLGRHRLVCGDARDVGVYDALMAGQAADMMFTDPPYNVPIDGFAGGKGKVERREFAMA